MLNQRIKVSSSTYLAPPIVNMVQNDSGRVLICEPFDYTITGAETATLICRRPNGTIFTYTGTVNADDNDVSVPLDAEGGALTQVGDVDAELILTASGSTITSFKITIRVQEDISGEATPEEKTFVAQLVAEVDASFADYQAALNDVEGQLDGLVPKTTKVNGKALSSDISLTPSDIGAVPETRTVNGHALDSNVVLDADDVGAVPEERTVNNYPLDDDINVMAVDVPFTPNGGLTSDNVQDAIDEVRDMIEVGREVELYDGSVTAIDAGTYPLDDDVANYQYLDIWIGYNGRYSIQRIPTREAITFSFRIPNISNSTSTFLYVAEIDLEFSGSVMTVTNVGAWQQASGSTYGPTRSQTAAIYIEKIYGIKYDAYGSGGGGGSIVVDNQLSPNSENPVQNKVLYNAILSGGGFSNAAKIALLNCFANVAWINDDGQQYYDALYDALYPETPPAQLVSITAVFDQTGVTIYDTDSLDDLKPYLTVTATYDDSTTEEVANYVLSGTLTVGTSTITVSYGGQTDTFDVTVTEYLPYDFYDYVYNTSSTWDWVDTGLTHNPSFGVLNVEFEAVNKNSSSSSEPLFGANNTTTSNTSNVLWYARANKAGFSAYNLGQAKQLNMAPGDTRCVCKYFFVDGGESYMQYENNTVAVATVSAASITSNGKTLLLAGGYSFSTGNAYGFNLDHVELGYIKFTDPSTNNVVYNFIPAHNTQTDKWGYYDTVNGVFYPSKNGILRCGNWT